MFKKINFNNVLFFILIILIIFGTYKLLKKKINLLEGFDPGIGLENEYKAANPPEKNREKINNILKKNIKNLIMIYNNKISFVLIYLKNSKDLENKLDDIRKWTEIKELLEKFQNSTSSMSSGVTNRMSGVTDRMYGATSSIIGNGGNGSGDEKEDETDEDDDGSMWPF